MMNQRVKLFLWLAFLSNDSTPLYMLTSWATSGCPQAIMSSTISDFVITVAGFIMSLFTSFI